MGFVVESSSTKVFLRGYLCHPSDGPWIDVLVEALRFPCVVFYLYFPVGGSLDRAFLVGLRFALTILAAWFLAAVRRPSTVSPVVSLWRYSARLFGRVCVRFSLVPRQSDKVDVVCAC